MGAKTTFGKKPASAVEKTANDTSQYAGDITERKRAEHIAIESKLRYRRLFEAAQDGILLIDFKTGMILDVNQFLINLLGYSKADFLKKYLWEVGVFKDIAASKDNFLTLQETRYVRFEDLPLETKAGKKIDVEFVANAYQVGEETIIQCNIRDITERKQMEEKMKKLNAKLLTDVKELWTFSYSVSHDLKAPLRAMMGFANILSEDYAPKLDDNGRRLIGVINDNVKKMGQLIEDLLKLAHLTKQGMDVVDIDVTTLVQSVCQELREELFRDRAIEVSVKPLPPARADYTLARQIFTNLISNAMKFTAHKENAVIEIGGYDKDGERVYYVKDNGAGFDMKYKDKLFGVFQRLHGQDEFSGTGIGLAIVSNAVRRHGGKVWAEGQVDKGATFYFTLPKGK